MNPSVALERLERFDFDAAEMNGLEMAGRSIAALRGFLDATEAKLARRVAVLHREGRGIPPEDFTTRATHQTRRQATRAQRRAETLGDAPAVEHQLLKGRISTDHADALAVAAGRLDDHARSTFLADDDDLAAAAAAMSPERYARFLRRRTDQLAADEGADRAERQRANTFLTLGIDEETGMGVVHGELHPEAFRRMRRALDGEVLALRQLPENEGRRTEQLNADALVNLVTGAQATRRRHLDTVVIHVDLDTMMNGLHGDTLSEFGDGTPVEVATARRLACDAEILPVVLDGDGITVDVGRAQRLATPDQRHALRSMYRTCAVDGCETPFDRCEVHHLVEWLEGGSTDLQNLLPVCGHHHHRAHEGRWRFELEPGTRELSVRLPNGTLLSRSRPDSVVDRTARPAA